MTRLTQWVLAHRRTVMIGWLLVTIVGAASVSSATGALSQTFTVPGREGSETNIAIEQRFHNGGNRPPLVPVVTLPAGRTVDSPGVRTELAKAFGAVSATLPGSRTASFASTGDPVFVSQDRRTTYALISAAASAGVDLPAAQLDAAQAAAGRSTVAGVPLRLTGTDVLAAGGGGGDGPGVLLEAVVGGVGALFVLAFVFASFVALVPLLMAVVAILTTFLLVWALTAVTEVSFIVQFLIALIGLGVAIDYALLIVVRWREERQKGSDNETAVAVAMEHAGRAVVFSGTTVAIGLLALIVLPVPFLRSVGYGGMLIPLVSVAVALTLLPAILASVGPRMDWPRLRHDDQASRPWTRWAQLVVRRRGLAAGVALAMLVALAIPALHLYPGDPAADSLASSGPARAGLQQLERSGIGTGALTPFEGLVRGGDASAVATAARTVGGVRGAIAPSQSGWRLADTALVDVIPTSDGNAQAGRDTLDRVRAVTGELPGGPRYGGAAAQAKDFVSAVYGNFPLMIALVVIITFLLLARAFRSLLLPLKAVLLNVLSVAAAYGILVLVWQDGHGSEAIFGIQATGAITQFVPLMVFAFLFGLSMDYEVFILARMREEYDRTGDTDLAVVEGIGRTGRLVTSAALILFLAFSSLASGPETTIKIFATGLAAGILLDATVVRALLVPALVSLFGRWNWWLPEIAAKLLRVPASPREPRAVERPPLPQPAEG
jgi:putative drug exporter of the RND superfamily